MSKKDNMISELLDGLDTLRAFMLTEKEGNSELRSLLRRMLLLLDDLKRMPSIEPSLYQKVLNMLSILFDAEHGTLLKRMYDVKDDDDSWEKFDAHLKTRKVLIDAAQQGLPSTLLMLRRGYELFGKPQPDTDDLSQNLLEFERYLREYLQGNSKVRSEFNLLTSALKGSVEAMGDVLDEVGSDSPELKHVQEVLERDLPPDPEEALALLQKARNDILKAGEKLSNASRIVKETMTAQVEQMNELSKRLESAEEQARNDPLTGLANRRKLREFFSTLPEHEDSVFLMIDIDHFKHINDEYGHDAGDDVLEKLARLLEAACRSTDMVARLGGEEFCVILPQADSSQGMSLAEVIRENVQAERFDSKQGSIDVRVSIGVAQRMANESIQDWLKRADKGLYHAKNNGRNQVVSAEQIKD